MAHAGYKGKIEVGGTEVGGMFAWNYDGESRDMEDIVEYGDAQVHREPTLVHAGDIACQGNVKYGDAGVALLEAAFTAATKYAPDAIKFYIDDTKYMTPTTGSTVVCTKIHSVDHNASGIAKVEIGFAVDGAMEEKADT